MRNPSPYLRFMLVISLSYTASTSLSSPIYSQKPSFSSSSSRKQCAVDLISLLGSKHQASTINTEKAKKFQTCLKFLVPFSPIQQRRDLDDRLSLRDRQSQRRVENELIWSPPDSILELARLAVDSGGDPGCIHRALDPTVIPVPDVEGSKECRCELTRTPYGRLFVAEEINKYFAFLFELIVARGPEVGFNVSLNRFDLFHGHLVLATNSGRLGILFHAKEHPAFDKDVFPYNMGYCQKGSNMVYDESMNLRNILWLAPLPSTSSKDWLAPGVLVVLDAHPGGIIYEDLIPEYAHVVRTIYEEDLGDNVVDVNYLNVGTKVADYRIFIC
ncbi:hypothetical protein MKW94_006522 [Papaver nudicaule]|uniref:Uncharacterized protein n=2 Tax=Papaver nudicaule TaxID=74823 RepID=A0AA42B477_PAPNU|nr:hypothetical protein [Papaver nudicaule]